jgi:protein phosphatase
MGDPLLELHLHACTDTGLVRSENEDAHALSPESGLAVLADGLGGGRAGEVASAMAVSMVTQALAKTGLVSTSQAPHEAALLQREQALRAAVTKANTAIYRRSREHADCAGMGTTLVAAQWCGEHLLVGHVGDSRAYLLQPRSVTVGDRVHRRLELRLLTRDHSTAQRAADEQLALVGAGAPARQPPIVNHQSRLDRPRLTRALGMESEVVLELHRHRVQEGDWVLLCSDGLTDMLGDDTIESIVNRAWARDDAGVGAAVTHAAQALMEASLAAGGRDNVTVVVGTQTPVGVNYQSQPPK